MSRNPARLGKADANQKAIADALRAIGCPVMDLSHAGNGVEDLLVGVRKWNPDFARYDCWWLPVECKVPPVRYKLAQNVWRATTEGWPRITVTSAQQAVDEIRRMTG
jgi:hypothetical protein